jgi:hypothetical protein
VGNTVKRMKKMKSGALAVHVEAGLLSTLACVLAYRHEHKRPENGR